MSRPTLDDVRAAATRIAGVGPAHAGAAIGGGGRWVGTRVHLKAEHLHATGAFKLRGASNAVLLLDADEAARGVVAHSSGNHASALALAAQRRGIRCTVVMPRGVPATKLAATEAAGAAVIICDPTLEARAATVAALVADTGAVEIHPFDDPRVIAGQGTAALELLEAVPAIGMLVAPVSGGGLLSGSAIAAHGLAPDLAVWGAEPTGADDAFQSLAAGRLLLDGPTDTIADGLVAQLSPRTFEILREHGVRVVTVRDDQTVEAMQRLARDVKQVVEPSGAVALAGLAQLARDGVPLPPDVGVIVSGGNVDLEAWFGFVSSGGPG